MPSEKSFQAAFVFNALERVKPQPLPTPRFRHSEQYFWLLPDPLREKVAAHDRHRFCIQSLRNEKAPSFGGALWYL